MNKVDVLTVVERIELLYPGRLKTDNHKNLIDAWYDILKDYELTEVLANLKSYAINNKFPPTINNLINPPKIEVDRYVPSVEETRKYLEEQEAATAKVKDDPKVKKAREEARNKINALFGR